MHQLLSYIATHAYYNNISCIPNFKNYISYNSISRFHFRNIFLSNNISSEVREINILNWIFSASSFVYTCTHVYVQKNLCIFPDLINIHTHTHMSRFPFFVFLASSHHIYVFPLDCNFKGLHIQLIGVMPQFCLFVMPFLDKTVVVGLTALVLLYSPGCICMRRYIRVERRSRPKSAD